MSTNQSLTEMVALDEDPALKLLNDGVDVKVIYPKEGNKSFSVTNHR